MVIKKVKKDVASETESELQALIKAEIAKAMASLQESPPTTVKATKSKKLKPVITFTVTLNEDVSEPDKIETDFTDDALEIMKQRRIPGTTANSMLNSYLIMLLHEIINNNPPDDR